MAEAGLPVSSPNTSSYATFNNEDVGNEHNKEFTVEEVVERIGFGRYQLFIAFAAGFAWTADGMEIMVLSILGPTLLCEWSLTKVQEAMLTTVVFLGFLIGSAAFGFFADKFGRRRGCIISTLWITIFGLATAAAPNLNWLLSLRFLVGIGVGGVPQVITYFAEFLPNKSRGRSLVLVELFWALGGSLEVLLGILVLRPFGWRWWLVATALPSFVSFVIFLFLPNSPRFDLITDNAAKAKRTLETAARWNHTELLEWRLLPEPTVPRGRILDLIRPGYRLTSALLPYLWFVATFCYYGVVLFTTELIQVGHTCDPGAFDSDVSPNATCEFLTMGNYVDLLWTSAAELPGIFITAVLIDLVGRKKTLITNSFIFGVVCMLLFICMQRIPMVFLLFVGRAISVSAFQAYFVYTSEVYPTEVRALGVGLCSSFGRVGAIVTPYVAQVLLNISLYHGLGVYAAAAFSACFVACLLPVETLGKGLKGSGGGSEENGRTREAHGSDVGGTITR